LSPVREELEVKLKFKGMRLDNLLEALKPLHDLRRERPLMDGEVTVYWRGLGSG